MWWSYLTHRIVKTHVCGMFKGQLPQNTPKCEYIHRASVAAVLNLHFWSTVRRGTYYVCYGQRRIGVGMIVKLPSRAKVNNSDVHLARVKEDIRWLEVDVDDPHFM